MNKQPFIFRTVVSIIVIGIFALSIYPLTQRDFFQTFESIASESQKDVRIQELIKKSKDKLANDPNLYPSIAFEETAEEMGMDLTDYIPGKDLKDNRDVIGAVRKQAAGSIRLGIDLNGGVEFLIQLQEDKSEIDQSSEEKTDTSADFEFYRDRVIERLRRRLEDKKIFETEIAPAGEKMISLKVPTVSKDEIVVLKDLIQRAGRLRFRLVHENSANEVAKYKDASQKGENYLLPPGYEILEVEANSDNTSKKQQKETHLLVKKRYEMKGDDLSKAAVDTNQYGQKQIALRFNADGTKRFGDVTRANVGRRLAIVLDGKLYSAPNIQDAIETGNAVITGDFSTEEAQNIANVLSNGSLPVKLNIAATFHTAPTLGKESVRRGAWAGIIALCAVIVFMSVYYLFAGIIADIALLVNIVLVLGALSAFEATLTLPGIAGIILTIGMAVDANVLIFERIREELNTGKSLPNAIENGYSRAFTTILDANLTTLFTAVILLMVGTGPIKGFAVTLSIGIITSMFSSLFLTRLIFDILMRFSFFKSLKMCRLFAKPKIDFLAMRYISGVISFILIVGSIIFIAWQSKEILGIDFTGGTRMTFDYESRVDSNELKNELQETYGFEDAKISYKSSGDDDKIEIVVRSEALDSNESSVKTAVSETLNTAFPDLKLQGGDERTLGGLIGQQFTKYAIIAIILALTGTVLYISARFEFAFAIAAIIAIIHDVIISTGVFVCLGRELSLPVIAALLTIIGYSLNDTIVVFDRIREDLTLETEKGYHDIINLSINQTMSRTILTSVTTLLVLIVLFSLGGVAINDFVLVMLIGVLVGTYSSIFVASPIVAVWHRKIGAKVKN